jgi:Ca2+/Na+ antiporter
MGFQMSQGVRAIQLRLDHAFLFTAVMTVLTASAWFNSALWMFNWLLLCPALYLLATARRPNRN